MHLIRKPNAENLFDQKCSLFHSSSILSALHVSETTMLNKNHSTAFLRLGFSIELLWIYSQGLVQSRKIKAREGLSMW